VRGVFKEGFWGQFARVFKEKIQSPPPPQNFTSIQKNFKTSPSKNFWIPPYKQSTSFCAMGNWFAITAFT